MIDRRTAHYHRVKKTVSSWMIFLILFTALVYILQPVQKPLSPCPESGCLIPHVATVKAVEPTTKPRSIEQKIRDTFPEDPDTAVAIAKCESSMNPKAINTKNRNGSVDYGLFQINSVHGYTANYLMDVDNNLRIARELYDRQGWMPWVCSWK